MTNYQPTREEAARAIAMLDALVGQPKPGGMHATRQQPQGSDHTYSLTKEDARRAAARPVPLALPTDPEGWGKYKMDHFR